MNGVYRICQWLLVPSEPSCSSQGGGRDRYSENGTISFNPTHLYSPSRHLHPPTISHLHSPPSRHLHPPSLATSTLHHPSLATFTLHHHSHLHSPPSHHLHSPPSVISTLHHQSPPLSTISHLHPPPSVTSTLHHHVTYLPSLC